MQYEVGDRVCWIDHDDEPEKTGTVYEADHEYDYYFIEVDLREGELVKMSSGMPGKNILGLLDLRIDGNVVSFEEFKMRNTQ